MTKAQGNDVLFWDEAGVRADTVDGRTWGMRGRTPVVEHAGQPQSFSALSAVSAHGAFWFCAYSGALKAKLFVTLLEQLMDRRRQPVHLIVDGLPAHKKACVRECVESTLCRLTLHFLPGSAPDLNPDELLWSHVKRTGAAQRPLRAGGTLRAKIEKQLKQLKTMPSLVRSFFLAPSVVYMSGC